jgi:hypothetical protein
MDNRTSPLPSQPPLAVDRYEAMRMLGIGQTLFERLIRDGEIAGFKIGNGSRTCKLLVPVTELQAYLDRRSGRAPARDLGAAEDPPVRGCGSRHHHWCPDDGLEPFPRPDEALR